MPVHLVGNVYIEDNPEEPGVKCLRMELSLSVMVKGCWVCGEGFGKRRVCSKW